MNLVVFIVLWVLWRQQELCHQKPKTPLRELLLTKNSQHSVVTKQPPVANRM